MSTNKFQLSRTNGPEGDFFEQFQNLGYRNGTILAILNLHATQCLPPCVGSIRLSFRKQMWFEDFQDGRRGGHIYRKETTLAILNTHVAPIPLTKFQLNLTYDSGGDVWNVKS